MDNGTQASNLRPPSMPRTLQPELLDTLSPQHPDAMHSRRDLRLINRVMGNYRWFDRVLPPLLRPGESVLELGAGAGELTELLASRDIRIDALDRCPPPDAWPAPRTWHRHDLQSFPHYADYDGVIGNLIFHHLSDDELIAVGQKISRHTRVIFACEPSRRRRSQFYFRFIATLLGVNHVTLHDAHVSIAAGFSGDELPRLLGLAAPAWQVRIRQTPFGAYRMIAVRRA